MKDTIIGFALGLLILVIGIAIGWRVWGGDSAPIDMDKVLSTSGEWVDLMPAGWHFIGCGECGYTYRFFYNAPGSWRATLSYDPLATEIMRDMMKIDAAPDEEPNVGPPEPKVPEVDL